MTERSELRECLIAENPDPDIATVYVWQNSMVMVFDSAGQQVPQYQGPLEEVGELLAAVFPRERWQHGVWNETHQLRRSPV